MESAGIFCKAEKPQATSIPHNTEYFWRGHASVMVNYRVENLDALFAAVGKEGVEIDPRREDYDYGCFAWIVDPEENRVELWEPPEMRMPTKSERETKAKGRRSARTEKAQRCAGPNSRRSRAK